MYGLVNSARCTDECFDNVGCATRTSTGLYKPATLFETQPTRLTLIILNKKENNKKKKNKKSRSKKIDIMHPATLHGVGVITKLSFAVFAAFMESVTLNLAHR